MTDCSPPLFRRQHVDCRACSSSSFAWENQWDFGGREEEELSQSIISRFILRRRRKKNPKSCACYKFCFFLSLSSPLLGKTRKCCVTNFFFFFFSCLGIRVSPHIFPSLDPRRGGRGATERLLLPVWKRRRGGMRPKKKIFFSSFQLGCPHFR